jgi:hypothetical protein
VGVRVVAVEMRRARKKKQETRNKKQETKNKETKKQRNKETKKQRNQETKKQRNQETKKQRKTKKQETKLSHTFSNHKDNTLNNFLNNTLPTQITPHTHHMIKPFVFAGLGQDQTGTHNGTRIDARIVWNRGTNLHRCGFVQAGLSDVRRIVFVQA